MSAANQGRSHSASDCAGAGNVRDGPMRFLQAKFVVPILLIVAIYGADQIRILRPDHKYRLTLNVETPAGTKAAAVILSVRPNRNYAGTGSGSSIPQTKGDAL